MRCQDSAKSRLSDETFTEELPDCSCHFDGQAEGRGSGRAPGTGAGGGIPLLMGCQGD